MLLIKYSADLSRGEGGKGEGGREEGGRGLQGGGEMGSGTRGAGTPIKETASSADFLPEINLLLIFDRYGMITSPGTDAYYRYCITGRYK